MVFETDFLYRNTTIDPNVPRLYDGILFSSVILFLFGLCCKLQKLQPATHHLKSFVHRRIVASVASSQVVLRYDCPTYVFVFSYRTRD
jgi:hypothetical protein